MNGETEYEIDLTDGEAVTSEYVDFYDSGVWVARETGRDFYPYERIEVVRERPAREAEPTVGAAEAEESPQPADERAE